MIRLQKKCLLDVMISVVLVYIRLQQWMSGANVPSSMGLLAQAAALQTSGSPSAAVSAAAGNASDTKRARFAPDLSALAAATSAAAIVPTSKVLAGTGTGPKPGATSTPNAGTASGHSQLQSAGMPKGEMKPSASASSGTGMQTAGSGTQGAQSTAGARGPAGSGGGTGGGGIRGITTSTAHPSSRDSSPDSSRGSLGGHSDSSTSASPGPRHVGKSISAFVYLIY